VLLFFRCHRRFAVDRVNEIGSSVKTGAERRDGQFPCLLVTWFDPIRVARIAAALKAPGWIGLI
jgi:hypothetical protein